jgi:hypothetical protein
VYLILGHIYEFKSSIILYTYMYPPIGVMCVINGINIDRAIHTFS